MTTVLPKPFGVRLTAEEYEALPPSRLFELVDGVLYVMTPPTGRHQLVVKNLERALEKACPAELAILREQEVRIGDEHRRIPDLLAIRAGVVDLDRASYLPDDILLAIEVVSPSTQTVDRIHKPGEYAQAGILHYWRVEPKPELIVHTYQLGETGHYIETGIFRVGDTMTVPGLPWAKVVVADLGP